MIQQVLDRYKRPFTMLDVGAGEGEYAFKAARDYDAVVVMIEADPRLLKLCKSHPELDRIILLHKPVILDDLRKLATCESFEVVLLRNIEEAAFDLGDNNIIEVKEKEVGEGLIARGAKVLGSDGEVTLYLIEKKKTALQRKTWLSRKDDWAGYEIRSDFTSKQLIKRLPGREEVSQWLAGINMLTFKMYRGAYPEKQTLKAALNKLTHEPHLDWTINNMVLQGKKIVLIDKDDPLAGHSKGRKCSKKVLKAHHRIIDIDDPAAVEHYFWHKLTQA